MAGFPNDDVVGALFRFIRSRTMIAAVNRTYALTQRTFIRWFIRWFMRYYSPKQGEKDVFGMLDTSGCRISN